MGVLKQAVIISHGEMRKPQLQAQDKRTGDQETCFSFPRGDTRRRRLAAEPLQPHGRVGDRENATIRSLLYTFSKKEHGMLEF